MATMMAVQITAMVAVVIALQWSADRHVISEAGGWIHGFRERCWIVISSRRGSGQALMKRRNVIVQHPAMTARSTHSGAGACFGVLRGGWGLSCMCLSGTRGSILGYCGAGS
jgi:hypothetical protein